MKKANTDEKEKAPKEKAAKPSGEGKARSGKGSREKSGGQVGVQIAAAGETRTSPVTLPRLITHYRKAVVPALQKQFQYSSPMQAPRLSKIVINCAVKEAIGNPKILDGTLEEIMNITGQKPVLTRAKKAIAAFKVRKGNTVGVMVTLRRARMYEFLDRLISIALPRVRDFRGINPKGFDGRGNYSLGVREQIIFPEINYDKVDKVRGMTVTIETTAKTNDEARALLQEMGMPFRKA